MRGGQLLPVRRLSDNFDALDPAGIDDHVVRREPIDDPIRAVEKSAAVIDGRRLRDLLGSLEFPGRHVALRATGGSQVRHLRFRKMNMDRVLSVLVKFMLPSVCNFVGQEHMRGMVLVLRRCAPN